MDELNERLSALLNDPVGMEKIKAMAQNLLGEPDEEPAPAPDFGGIDMASITKMMSLMNTKKDDARIRLLLALKPNLSPEKQKKVDSAIKLLKLIDLAPLLKEAGLFNL